MRVLLADDHSLIRHGLRALLGREPDIEVVAEAADGNTALAAAARLKPDVLIIDVNMPGPSGLRVVAETRRYFPAVRTIVLTMYEEASYVRTALAAGASGYVVKRSVDEELLLAVRAVERGRRYLCQAVRGAVEDGGDFVTRDDRGPTPLSTRERQVLRLVALGHTSEEIAGALKVGPKSIESYRARFKQKLGLATRADVVRYALEIGLLRSEDPSVVAVERQV